MLVHVAENGLSFELDCTAATSVEEVQCYLASLTRVSEQDQLLIVGDARLESQRLLGSYRLPHDARPVFLFNRQRLSPDCAAPAAEGEQRFSHALYEQQDDEQQAKQQQQQHSPLALDESRDPALRALPSYERQFRYHLDKGRAAATLSQKKLDACRMLLREQQVQEMAMETARANMEHYYKMIDQLYQDFIRHFNRQHRHHSELLANFDRDLERLRLCKLHPALRSDTKKALIDCVKEGSLRKWADDCAISHKQFAAKVLHLKNEYIVLQRSVEDLLVTGSTVNVRLLDEAINKHVHYAEEQSSIIQSLSKDVNTVRKLIDECASGQFTASMRPQDAVSALGPMYDVHDKSHLPRIRACDAELRKLLETCSRSKNEMSMGVHMRMQNVAALQANIRDMRNQLSAFKEAMARQDDIFDELKVVRKVGSAYKACLAEAVRRRACMKLYMGQAGQLAEKLARKREVEIARREDFLQLQSVYIPRDVLGAMGLFDFPSQCIVNIAPFDLGLLDIDIADIERYAPESLVGALYKVDEGSPGFGGELDSRESSDLLDEIAGTSKVEVENTWLKAELASAISMLCNLDPEFEPEAGSYSSSGQQAKVDDGEAQDRSVAARKTAEALRLKDSHAKQLHGMLAVRQHQCQAYEKRIRELEARLREQDVQIQKQSSGNDSSTASLRREQQLLDSSENSGLTVAGRHSGSVEPMDEGVSSRFPRERNLVGSSCTELSDEGLDENMVETPASIDVTMTERHKKDHTAGKALELICQVVDGAAASEKISTLESALNSKTAQCGIAEEKLEAAVGKIAQLSGELDCNNELLRECQMNCAHLENRLHEAREEARMTAERRAAEHTSLRNSSMRLRGLMERLKHCMSSPVDGAAAFAESLRALSASMNSCSEGLEDPGLEYQSSIRILADRVAALVQQRAEVLERCSSLEAAQVVLNKEIESKAAMLKSLYAKHKLEKQACKEKLCFTHFELHELAVFMPNPAGHWEAVNRNCPNYYLSDESIALFVEHLPSGQQYIVGQIVHINRNTAKPPSAEVVPPNAKARHNPYGLPIACEYFVVTVAMVPDLHVKFVKADQKTP